MLLISEWESSLKLEQCIHGKPWPFFSSWFLGTILIAGNSNVVTTSVVYLTVRGRMLVGYAQINWFFCISWFSRGSGVVVLFWRMELLSKGHRECRTSFEGGKSGCCGKIVWRWDHYTVRIARSRVEQCLSKRWSRLLGAIAVGLYLLIHSPLFYSCCWQFLFIS